MNRLFVHIVALSFALLAVGILLFVNKKEILHYYAKPLKETLEKTVALQNDLENGKIVLFGSSELVFYPNQRFLPQNFFNNELQQPIKVQGNEGQQSFAIFSQLAACENDRVKENAKVVILLSPSWFTGKEDNGTKIPKFLEFMYPGMMNKLYFQSTAKEEYKVVIQEYIKKNIDSIKNPNYLYTTSIETIKEEYFDNKIKEIIIDTFDNRSQETIDYKNPLLDYEKLKIEAQKIVAYSNNNSFGIQNEYYTKFIEPSIQNGTFPFSIMVPKNLSQNQEYQDFLLLLELLQSYQIKPFFVIEDLHPEIFSKNRDEMTHLIVTIKSKLEEYEYSYFDMWSYEKKEYEMGTLIDMVHMGELGWLKINQQIIDYFMPQQRD